MAGDWWSQGVPQVEGWTLTWNLQNHLLFNPDNTYDVGANGATRPRNLFVAAAGTFGTAISAGTNISAGASGSIGWTGRAAVTSPADGVVLITVAAGTANSGQLKTGSITTLALTVATLPATPVAGQRAFVTDSNAVSFTAGIGAVVAAGGSTAVPVVYDGTNWRIG
jgi:hypothetical protein